MLFINKCTSFFLPAGVSLCDQDVFFSCSGDSGVEPDRGRIWCRILLLVVLVHCRGSGAPVCSSNCNVILFYIFVTVTNRNQQQQQHQTKVWSSVHQDLGESFFFLLEKTMDLNHLVLSENRDKSVLFCFVFSNLLQSRLQNVFGYLCVTSCPAQTGSSILALVRCCWL